MTVITFLTDFGLQDDFVGTCHGVIAGIAPDARVIDLTHGIAAAGGAPGRARRSSTRCRSRPSAFTSRSSTPTSAATRRAIAVRTIDGRVFVGPDNGLLMLAADDVGVDAAHELTDPRYRLPGGLAHVPRPRHLRAGGRAPRRTACRSSDLGPRSRAGRPRADLRARARGRARRSCLRPCSSVDRFGNVATNVRREHLDALGVADGDRVEVRLGLDRYYAARRRTRSPTPRPAS